MDLLSSTSYETALCIILPVSCCYRINRLREPIPNMSDLATLESILHSQRMIPTKQQIAARQEAFELLKYAVLDNFDDQIPTNTGIFLHIVAVGSYALGTWTLESDLNCICIGSITSKTFFKLARQRLAKAQGKGIRILRKAETKTGKVLELSVNGIATNLQYCPAAKIAER